MELPLWATPARRAWLVELAQAYLAAYEMDFFTGRVVNPILEEVISAWKADDRALRSQLWKREQRKLHAMPKLIRRGPFDSVRREQYLNDRPVFEIVGVGVSAFTQHRVAQAVIPGLDKTLWVDLSGIKLSKNKLHKLARYQRGSVPKELVPQVEARVQERIRAYLS